MPPDDTRSHRSQEMYDGRPLLSLMSNSDEVVTGSIQW